MEVAERYSDRLATSQELQVAHVSVRHFGILLRPPPLMWALHTALEMTTLPQMSRKKHGFGSGAALAANSAAEAVALSAVPAANHHRLLGPAASETEWFAAADTEKRFQCAMVRDIFGNPFRPKAIDPDWLTWNHGTVPLLARRIYEERVMPERRFDVGTMAVLGDACGMQGVGMRRC